VYLFLVISQIYEHSITFIKKLNNCLNVQYMVLYVSIYCTIYVCYFVYCLVNAFKYVYFLRQGRMISKVRVYTYVY